MTIDPGSWHALKSFLTAASGLSMDALHVILGVLIQLLAARLLRCSLADGRPWLVVALLQLLNEAHDLWFERWPSLAMQLGEGARDCVATLLLPTLLLLLARGRPELLGGPR